MVEKVQYRLAFPERIIQSNMLKADLIRYYSQLHCFPWTSVSRRTCGITAAAMAISFFQPDIEPIDVLIKATEIHKVPSNAKNLWLSVNSEKGKINIPAGQELDEKLLEAIKTEKLNLTDKVSNKETEYKPIFSLANGYDHRGSRELFGSYGIKAEMLGDKDKPLSQNELRKRMRSGMMFMASVTNSITPWMNFSGGGPNTHILLLTDIVEIDSTEWYHIVDPYSPSSLKAVFYQPVDGFHDIEFNGFGTAIHTKAE